MNSGLFPATIFVRRDFVIDIGQLKPKQISIIASYILIIALLVFVCSCSEEIIRYRIIYFPCVCFLVFYEVFYFRKTKISEP